MILKVVVFLFLGWLVKVNGNQYIYVNQSKTWEEAREYCRQKGFELSTLNGQEIEICNLTEATELWTNNFTYTTPYLSLLGCYINTYGMRVSSLNKASVVECQMLCRDSPRFAIQAKSCTCLQSDFDQGAVQNAARCNYTCDGQTICGGHNAVSIYEKANISDPLTEQPLFPPNNSRCLVYQCVSGAVEYQEKDCENQELANDDNYFSCSFEPYTDCFLWQAKDNDLEWSIKNSPPQNSPELSYDPSYYAHVNGSGGDSGQTAVLISRIKFKASNWCLRFRYLTDTSASMDVIIWDLITNETNSLKGIRTPTSTMYTDAAWYLVERNVRMTNDFKLMFKFESDNKTDISIDDVTMIADSCNETVSTLLKKEKGIQCTFGGDFDVCFRQDELNDVTNWNLTNNVRWLSIGKVGDTAVLVSKFELYDINVNISVKYSSKNNLKLYWIDEERNKTNTIIMNNTYGSIDIISRMIFINASSNLYILGNITETYQNLKIDFIKIDVISKSNTQVERDERPFQIPDPYAMTLFDVTHLRCIVSGGIMTSNTIKLLGNLLPKNGMPSAVQIYRKNDSYWETFNSTSLRTFFCEKDSRSNNICEIPADFIQPREEVQNTTVLWIAVVLVCLLVLITIGIASIIVFKRRQISKNKQNTKGPSTGEPNSIKLTYKQLERTQNDNVEEDYDHLHQNQTNAHASLSEKVYSHMTDNQYGILPVISDDTYDNSIPREGEYGTTQVCQEAENTYDHT